MSLQDFLSSFQQSELINKAKNNLLNAKTQIGQVLVYIFAVSSAWTVGEWSWQLMAVPTEVIQWQPSAQQHTGIKRSEGGSSDISELMNANLFGHFEGKENDGSNLVENAPQTQLNLVLVGVVSSTDAQEGIAVIANNSVQATYGVGETIEGTSAELMRVFPEKVIIRNAGRDETLMLEGIDYASHSLDIATQHVHTEKKLEDLRNRIKKHPQELFKYLHFSPVTENGRAIGFKVRPGKDRYVFDTAGLQLGDMVTKINGLDVTVTHNQEDIWDSLNELEELRLTVIRDGQESEISIEK